MLAKLCDHHLIQNTARMFWALWMWSWSGTTWTAVPTLEEMRRGCTHHM